MEALEELGELARAEALARRVKVAEQVLVELARVGEAVVGLAREHLHDDLGERLRRALARQLERRVLARVHAARGLEHRRRRERVAAGEHLVEHRAEREQIAPAVDRLGLRLLGAHVRELSAHATCARVARLVVDDRVPGLGDAEVGDLHLALPREQNILRRDVAVDDAERPPVLVAATVRVIERLGDLGREEHRHAERHGHLQATAAREHRGEVEPRHVLHRDEVAGGLARRIVDAAEIEHLDDVGVREPHRELRLVDEHVDELRVRGQLRQNALDDEDFFEALDAEALRLEDLGHPALAEALQEPITAERLFHE